jgi:hypothetical protein
VTEAFFYFEVIMASKAENSPKILIQDSFNGLFHKWQTPLKNGFSCYNKNTNDFGVAIKSLMFTKPNGDSDELHKHFLKTGLKVDHFAKNLTQLANQFGFELVFSKYQYVLRDHLLRLPDGKCLTFAISLNTPVAIERCESRAMYYRAKASYQTDHFVFKGSLGSANSHSSKATAELQEYFEYPKEAIPTLRFYIEGGNLYSLTNSFGHNVVLIGEDVLYIALNQMRRDGFFKNEELSLRDPIKEYTKELKNDPAFLKETLEEMYVQGLLKEGVGIKKGFIDREGNEKICHKYDHFRKKKGKVPYSNGGNPYIEQAIKMGLFIPFEIPEQDLIKGLEIAASYLAQKDMTQFVIGKSFSVPSKRVVFVPQLDYHLDVFMRPGPKGSLFVQDYSFCLEFLEEINSKADVFLLSDLDKMMLKRYLETAQKLSRELGPLTKKIKGTLSSAGFTVIPAPGIFYDVSPDLFGYSDPNIVSTSHLNFLNAITGWSEKENSYFYFVTGAGVGDKLGEVLMRSYEDFIKRYQPNTQVHFIGHDPDHPKDFAEGMRWLNRRGSQLGPHCLSFELETASHEDNSSV